MYSKKFIWLGLFLGSIIGSYVPTIWGTGIFSFTSILFGMLGGAVGIWLGFKIGQLIDY
jgi:hypothetical protein